MASAVMDGKSEPKAADGDQKVETVALSIDFGSVVCFFHVRVR